MMTARIEMDEPMKMLYRTMHKIDVDSCVRIGPKISDYTIEVGGETQPVKDFVKERSRVVTLDHFSTKDINDEAIKGMPPGVAKHYEKLYAESNRMWAVFEDDGKAFGVGDSARVYNGYPAILDVDRFLVEPQEEWKRALGVAMGLSQPEAMTRVFAQSPITVVRSYLGFTPEFLADNVLFDGDGRRVE